MKQEEVKVSFYLKKNVFGKLRAEANSFALCRGEKRCTKENEPDAAGRCPVMARLAVGSSTCVFGTKLTAPWSLWTSGRMKGKSAAAVEINRRLDEMRASAIAICRELSAVHARVTAEEIKCRLLGMASGQETLLGHFGRFIERFEKHVGVDRSAKSAACYKNTFKHLSRFLSAKFNLTDMPFRALDRSLIERFDLYLRSEQRLAPSTIVLFMSRLKTVVGKAIASGIFTTDPFAEYEPQRPRRQQRYLTREELHRLMTTPLPSPNLYHIRDLFLFSCYTGISYGDLCRLTDANLETAEDGTVWIKATREKTNVEFEIPLLDLPLRILDKYDGLAPDDKLLPMYCNSTINLSLKAIATLCGIDRKLTFHMARHTYATEITLSHGVPIETVSRMLGHSRIDTTQIYAEVTDGKIETDTRQLDGRIAERFPSVAI
ncbi:MULTISPECIES: site-specific integrase [Alistipes]|uniref:site-specific integrase n=1 Tax=Alistipes TaxID=239759 RepID=UPI00214BE8A4|nr:site-specific integrase [Alistipes timonensis]MCR2031557.1 site-specific integrase [Alistipes timonensis]